MAANSKLSDTMTTALVLALSATSHLVLGQRRSTVGALVKRGLVEHIWTNRKTGEETTEPDHDEIISRYSGPRLTAEGIRTARSLAGRTPAALAPALWPHMGPSRRDAERLAYRLLVPFTEYTVTHTTRAEREPHAERMSDETACERLGNIIRNGQRYEAAEDGSVTAWLGAGVGAVVTFVPDEKRGHWEAEREQRKAEDEARAKLGAFSDTCPAAMQVVGALEENSDTTMAETGTGCTDVELWAQVGDHLDMYPDEAGHARLPVYYRAIDAGRSHVQAWEEKAAELRREAEELLGAGEVWVRTREDRHGVETVELPRDEAVKLVAVGLEDTHLWTVEPAEDDAPLMMRSAVGDFQVYTLAPREEEPQAPAARERYAVGSPDYSADLCRTIAARVIDSTAPEYTETVLLDEEEGDTRALRTEAALAIVERAAGLTGRVIEHDQNGTVWITSRGRLGWILHPVHGGGALGEGGHPGGAEAAGEGRAGARVAAAADVMPGKAGLGASGDVCMGCGSVGFLALARDIEGMPAWCASCHEEEGTAQARAGHCCEDGCGRDEDHSGVCAPQEPEQGEEPVLRLLSLDGDRVVFPERAARYRVEHQLAENGWQPWFGNADGTLAGEGAELLAGQSVRNGALATEEDGVVTVSTSPGGSPIRIRFTAEDGWRAWEPFTALGAREYVMHSTSGSQWLDMQEVGTGEVRTTRREAARHALEDAHETPRVFVTVHEDGRIMVDDLTECHGAFFRLTPVTPPVAPVLPAGHPESLPEAAEAPGEPLSGLPGELRGDMWRMRVKDVSRHLKRSVLKAAFPGVKFSVRTAPGSMVWALDIVWEGGPKEAEVRAVCDPYQGADSNGHTDSYDRRERPLVAVEGRELPVRLDSSVDSIRYRRERPAGVRELAVKLWEEAAGEPCARPECEVGPLTVRGAVGLPAGTQWEQLSALMDAVEDGALDDSKA